MKSDLSLDAIKTFFGRIFSRYHFLIFFLLIAVGLGTAVILLNMAIAKSDDADGYTSNVNTINFDDQTIERLRQLKSSDQTTDKIESNGRTNPF